ncbi:MAG: putative quinol monooxygenase [Planctomycetota bacterium]
MVDLIVILRVRDLNNLSLLKELLAQQILMSREEPGCIRLEAHESQAEPGTFFLVEQWASQDALDAHRKGHACTTLYFPKIVPLVDRTPHMSVQLPGT